ncbi:MAG: hypothetical protein US96_C0029G0002 [Candidatus Woesebacteria bacterium GW2011_GWB1_38_5b]|uniref:Uncharacterized protein n=1 Tax=Candidatus Woesebacteria bacterium GW2011_GWB1_38_5b TaxID=1618569 RepID=A0A0G0K4G8_9BACT|nr:MAG: hypothetical protein US96_C0029G0002 [Candidatus Woesebacteria bacterium GW2011_GWB1_38_5b]
MDNKSHDINIRIDGESKFAFKEKCKKENKTMSEKILEFILKQIKCQAK